MMFMNRGEVMHAAEIHCDKPVLGPATQLLYRFMELVDENSDGWPYWSAAPKAARRLMELIQDPHTATANKLARAKSPIKAFCTRHGFKFPVVADAVQSHLGGM